jgi:hypothetical protein
MRRCALARVPEKLNTAFLARQNENVKFKTAKSRISPTKLFRSNRLQML